MIQKDKAYAIMHKYKLKFVDCNGEHTTYVCNAETYNTIQQAEHDLQNAIDDPDEHFIVEINTTYEFVRLIPDNNEEATNE